MSVSSTCARFQRTFGLLWRPPPQIGLPALGLVGSFTEIERDPVEPVVAGFSIARIAGSTAACSVGWRVEGTGDNPVLAEHFGGGVLPVGTAILARGATSFGASLLISAGDAPAVALTGRIVLEAPIGCRIAPDRAELLFSIAAGEIGVDDAIMGLSVPFTVLERDPDDVLVCGFDVVRSGNESVACSVAWRVEGTGASPVLGSDFDGGELPSGTESFSADELVETTSFSLAAGAGPAIARTGRLVLHTPVDCKIDPAHATHAFSLAPADIPASVWDFTAANMAVHTPAGQESRVSFGGGVVSTTYRHTLNLSTNRTVPSSEGGDLWCSAQASTGAVYTFCGDGPGSGRRSLALARINGTTLGSLSLTWLIGGPSPSVLGGFETRTGYTSETVGGNSYLDGKTTTCACRGDWLYYFVAEAPDRGWGKSRLFRRPISSLGTAATVAGWGFGASTLGTEKYNAICPALLIAGQNQDDAEDAYQYCLVMRYGPVTNPDDSPRHFPAQHWLARFPLDGNWLDDNWEWLTGVDVGNTPIWGAFASKIVVPGLNLPDNMGWRPSWFYNAPIGRYIYQNEHGFVGNSTFWTIMAPKPWGPWEIIDDRQYVASDVATDLAQLHIIPSTLSADGLRWLLATWGGTDERGLDADKFIATSSTLAATTVGDTAAGLIIAGAANDDAHNVAAWFKTIPPQNYELTFDFEVTEDDAPADAGGRFAQVWIAYEGTTGSRPADVTAWTTSHYRPSGYDPVSDSVYGDFGKGGRISWFTSTTDAGNADQARLVMWDEGVQTRPAATPATPSFPMGTVGTKYRIIVRREGEKITISKTPGGQSVQWTHPDADRRARIGFRFGRGRGGALRHVADVPFMRDLGGVTPPPPSLARMIYYAGYSRARLAPSALPMDASVTHYMHFSVFPTSSGGLDYTSNDMPQAHRTATIAAVHAGGKEILLSVGGAGSIADMRLAANDTNRATFVANLVAAVVNDNYKGLDVDWEPLEGSDQTNYRALINALRAALPSNKLLTTAIPVSSSGIAAAAGVIAALDYINLMTYDMSGPWEEPSWHHSALLSGGNFFPSTTDLLHSAERYVDAAIAAGIPVAKLGLGLAFYGRDWTGGTGTDTGGVTRPLQTWTVAPDMDSETLPYHEIVTLRATMTDLFDDAAQAAYLSSNPAGSASDRFIPYDSEAAVTAKVKYAKAKGLGSLIAWMADDQFIPAAPAALRHPLLAKINEEMGGVTPPPPPPSGEFPGDWRVWQRATSGPNRILVSTPAELRSRIASGQSGQQLLTPAGATWNLGGDLIIDRAVSGTDALYIATDTDSDDPAAATQFTGGRIVIGENCRRVVVNNFRCNGAGAKTLIRGGSLFQIERIVYSGMPGEGGADPDSYKTPALIRIEGDPADFLLGFLHSQNNGASFWDVEASRSPVRMLMTHWWEDRATVPAKWMQPGRGPRDGGHDLQAIAQNCLSSGRANYPDDLVEFKFNGLWLRNNSFEMASHPDMQIKIRQGRLGEPGRPGPARGNTFESNLYILPLSGGNQPWGSTRGAYHKWINNWCVRLGPGESPSLTSPLGNGRLTCFVGASNGETFPESSDEPDGCNRRCGAFAAQLGGNRGFRVSAEWDNCARNNPQPGGPFRPRRCRIAPGSSSGRPDRNTAVDLTDFLETDSTTPVAGANYEKVPVRMFPNMVGPRAWRAQFAQVLR